MARSPEVDAWFENYHHPMRELMQEVRQVILANERIEETLKWKSPTYMYQGNIASFNPRTKSHVSLMFHTGAKIPGEFDVFEGGGDTARYVKITDSDDLATKTAGLRAVIDAWCDWKGSGG